MATVFSVEFLRGLLRRGLKGIKLAIADVHEGAKGGDHQVLGAKPSALPRHFVHNMLGYIPKSQYTIGRRPAAGCAPGPINASRRKSFAVSVPGQHAPNQ